MANHPVTDQSIDDLRRFNRFYTRHLGVLEEGLLHSPFTLVEARILYELAHRHYPTARELREELRLDAGYLSRILSGLRQKGLIDSHPSPSDARETLLGLTREGKKAFALLDQRSSEQIREVLSRLSQGEQAKLIRGAKLIEDLLSPRTDPKVPYLLRPLQPGDLGWIVHRHGFLYSTEYAWDERFEALVAKIASEFVAKFNPKRERCWIAERESEIVGCVFVAQKSKTTAQLRLLLVEPEARGLGIGRRLVDECLRFARQAGYRKMILWTNNVLSSARRIYEKAGFKLTGEEPHHDFGPEVVGETWELTL